MVKQNSNSSLKKEIFTCDLCKKIFPNLQCLRQHCLKIHEENDILSCKVCEKSIARQSMRLHMKLHDEHKFSCEVCG